MVMTTSPTTILFAGGGSGGHLYPGVSVAQSLARLLPSMTPLFLCTNREIDSTILNPTGYEFVKQPIVPPKRTVSGLIRFWRGWRQTHDVVKTILRERAPMAVLGLGGYAAGVAVKLAKAARIPTAILNPDVIPGKATLHLLSCVQRVCCQFDSTRDHVPAGHQSKIITTGCPIRSDMTVRIPRDQAARHLGLDPLLNTLVVTGASQGAVTVNQAVLESLKIILRDQPSRKLQGWQILHLAGKDNAESVRAEYRELELPAVVIDFTPAMLDVWSVADLTVSRSGASTCAELMALRVPSVLMPYPFHRDNHQMENAKVLMKAGAAEILPDLKQRKANGKMLAPLIELLLYDAPRRNRMSEAAGLIAKPDAAERVAQVMLELISQNADQ